jgi:ubiquinone/menaquinone biosynthesis C-methylase UbiE
VTPDVQYFFIDNMDKLEGRVLEVGSYNVNGSLKQLLPNRIGTDMRPGPEVDVVCKAEDLLKHFPPESFDAVISAETLEHIEDWRGAVKGMWDVLKPQGWLVCTMASVKKGRHAYPDDYWRMLPEHVMRVFPDCESCGNIGRISLGWTVQKKRALPDLSEIELIKVP